MYTEKEIGSAYVYEPLEQGYFRVISEDGRNDCLRGQNLAVGQVGKLIYYSDGASYGLTKFVPDALVQIDFEKLVHNYNEKWNANTRI